MENGEWGTTSTLTHTCIVGVTRPNMLVVGVYSCHILRVSLLEARHNCIYEYRRAFKIIGVMKYFYTRVDWGKGRWMDGEQKRRERKNGGKRQRKMDRWRVAWGTISINTNTYMDFGRHGAKNTAGRWLFMLCFKGLFLEARHNCICCNTRVYLNVGAAMIKLCQTGEQTGGREGGWAREEDRRVGGWGK